MPDTIIDTVTLTHDGKSGQIKREGVTFTFIRTTKADGWESTFTRSDSDLGVGITGWEQKDIEELERELGAEVQAAMRKYDVREKVRTNQLSTEQLRRARQANEDIVPVDDTVQPFFDENGFHGTDRDWEESIWPQEE